MNEYRIKITRYANAQVPHIQRRGMTCEDLQYMIAEFTKDKPKIIEELDKACCGKNYRLEFKPSFTIMRSGGVVDVFAIVTETKYATFLKLKIQNGDIK